MTYHNRSDKSEPSIPEFNVIPESDFRRAELGTNFVVNVSIHFFCLIKLSQNLQKLKVGNQKLRNGLKLPMVEYLSLKIFAYLSSFPDIFK